MKEYTTINAPEPSNYTKLTQDTPVDSQNGEYDVVDSVPKKSSGYESVAPPTADSNHTYCKVEDTIYEN